jgi:hypothetical protein
MDRVMSETSHAMLYYFNAAEDNTAHVAINLKEVAGITAYSYSSSKPYGIEIAVSQGRKYLLMCKTEEDQMVVTSVS